jgi:RNA polymerase sigma-70 factor, ECF subfamily
MINPELCREKSDEELVKLVLENQDYFICLMQRYSDKLIRYIIRISGVSQDDAEDILQDIFIKVYKNLNDFNTGLKFSSWIYRIAHNHTISNYRKAKSRGDLNSIDLDDEGVKELAAELSIQKNIDQEITKVQVGKILNQLDPKYKEVLVLRFLEEKDYNEIADILKKPLGTIATLINRAKKQFKQKALSQNINF